MLTQHLRIDNDGPVARVTLSRPELHNALNDRLVAEIRDTFLALALDDHVRAVVLTGDGISFCAGADLAWLQRAVTFTEEENRADALHLVEMLDAIDSCPKPVIARVNGAALAGGAGLVAASDIAVAASTARFGFTEARLGLVPATISPYVVRKIGHAHARALFLTAERFEAPKARDIGLVHEVVDSDLLDSAVDRILRNVLAGGPRAQAENKALLAGIRERSGVELGEYTAATIARLRIGEEGQEGLRAFLEKRSPGWTL
jgi:methylglutaconyl-CoA hydratase